MAKVGCGTSLLAKETVANALGKIAK